METSDPTQTPVVTNVNINYVSGCFTPGQAIFTNLQESNDYIVKVTKDGYTIKSTDTLNVTDNNANVEVLLDN